MAWWTLAVAGQAIFTAYVGLLYGDSALRGQFDRWNEVMPRGGVRDDSVTNLVVAAHLFFAALVVVSGALQLPAVVRRRAPSLHRWNGRLYVPSAAGLAISGLALVAAGRAPGDGSQHAGTMLNALLVLTFAVMAWREALARRFDRRRRWALRLLLAVAGVWFFRIARRPKLTQP